MTDSSRGIFPTETSTQEHTRSVGSTFGKTLSSGAVVALFGELGSGKTQFVKGICEALGVEESLVSSPTFTIVNEYEGSVPVYHLDLYRIKKQEEALEFGFVEYVESKGICLIEWPEVVETLLPPHTVGLRFRHVVGDIRRIERLSTTQPEK